MQHSQNLHDVFIKAKKVIYFCKFTFNHKIFFFCLDYIDCGPCSPVCLQIITTVLEQYEQGIEADAPGTEPHGAPATGRCTSLHPAGSQAGIQAGWKLSCGNSHGHERASRREVFS